ncbi:MAG: hypothetical protein RL701_1326 [Pseudomonadota bacterium]|jgi:sec-independent protein translocase protein TatB
MFNIGFGELAIICIVLIIAVGPERLPSMMKSLGKTLRTLRQASRDIRASTGIDELMREDFDLYTPPAPRRPLAPQLPAAPAAPEPLGTPVQAQAQASSAIVTAPGAGETPAAPTAAPGDSPVSPEPKPISREDLVEVTPAALAPASPNAFIQAPAEPVPDNKPEPAVVPESTEKPRGE